MLKIQIKLSNKMHSENSVENAIILTRRGGFIRRGHDSKQ